MEKKAEELIYIEDEILPDLTGFKFAPILFGTGAGVVANKDYFLIRDADIEDHIVTGIELWSTQGSARFPSVYQYGGQNYNVITSSDRQVCFFNFKDKSGRYILRNIPFDTLIRYPFECPYMWLDIDMGQSYVKFTQAPLATPLPMIIPVYFFFNREKIF